MHAMRWKELLPNFRCTRRGNQTYVEIPAGYSKMSGGKPTTNDGPDAEAHRMLRRLIHDKGRRADIFDEVRAEATGDHKADTHGALVPLDDFEMVLGGAIPDWFRVPQEAKA